MWKPILAGTTALVIAGSTFVYAQNRQDGARRWQPTIEDMRAFGDARLAALRAGLALSAEQEKNWPAFEQAARDFQKLRLDRLREGMEARRSGQPRTTDPVERMEKRATTMSETGAALKKLADATGPLYKSLDDGQKRRFTILNRMGSERGRGRMHRWMNDGGPGGSRRTENQDMVPMHRSFGMDHRSMELAAPVRGEERL